MVSTINYNILPIVYQNMRVMVWKLEKSKIMVNSRDKSLHANIRNNGDILKEVGQFKYLGSIITKDGTSEADIRIRLATSTFALIRIQTIWKSTKVGFKTKLILYIYK